ncbi:bifunctional adenosylcobinamide kinase/adenosylcobinamide-phosphate guanylyltransferase [Cohnella lupini]|uniref:Adenosylcobinamide kinase /adenosylcobinamide-phosphate guanylyltransferase n=1 Tax=Cohnella lupini TaxID=1294267 RepID=A0A3D9IQ02_9BACL|nr:bifunctional adenosylcobinamide kinase/adenosylcobinamide-phosphate guanylyltransferase [Cohnella lupini]RED63851.1 adenosylcobinamide kinase /adenosylcobinamide-phosphate guanylyltransferase [Cohnella lupini]
MLWLITGGIGSGKTEFANELARSLGREGIVLACPPFPDRPLSEQRQAEWANDPEFPWTHSDADETLAHKLTAINMESNIFRADRRVLVVDSLSGWLRGLYMRMENTLTDDEAAVDGVWHEALAAILSYEGKMIVVTEEPANGLSINRREQGYAYRLAAANRVLLEASACLYRMTAGMATEVKGYRLKRGKSTNENIYTDR